MIIIFIEYINICLNIILLRLIEKHIKSFKSCNFLVHLLISSPTNLEIIFYPKIVLLRQIIKNKKLNRGKRKMTICSIDF